MRRDGAVLCYILHKDTKLYLLPQGIYKMCKTCKAWKSLLAWEGESPCKPWIVPLVGTALSSLHQESNLQKFQLLLWELLTRAVGWT